MGKPQPPPTRTVTDTAALYVDVQQSPEFRRLRRLYRNFAFPMTVAFFVWYLLFVLLNNYAAPVMKTKLIGHINLGFVIGVLQFVTTFLITWLYERHSDRELDPLADKLKTEIETEAR